MNAFFHGSRPVGKLGKLGKLATFACQKRISENLKCVRPLHFTMKVKVVDYKHDDCICGCVIFKSKALQITKQMNKGDMGTLWSGVLST